MVDDTIAPPSDTPVHVGDRIGFIDGWWISLGTIRTVDPLNDLECIVRVTWDDEFDDTEDDGRWAWPNRDLKLVR